MLCLDYLDLTDQLCFGFTCHRFLAVVDDVIGGIDKLDLQQAWERTDAAFISDLG